MGCPGVIVAASAEQVAKVGVEGRLHLVSEKNQELLRTQRHAGLGNEEQKEAGSAQGLGVHGQSSRKHFAGTRRCESVTTPFILLGRSWKLPLVISSTKKGGVPSPEAPD